MFRILVTIWLVSMLAFYTFDYNTIEVRTDEPIKVNFVRPPVFRWLVNYDQRIINRWMRSKLTTFNRNPIRP
ncbi:hypothetical protein F4X10_00610 [Candidatus Poribacteria bacterium]|nr:hypothetical protein [Candidatus Poribacteria bacterium]